MHGKIKIIFLALSPYLQFNFIQSYGIQKLLYIMHIDTFKVKFEKPS